MITKEEANQYLLKAAAQGHVGANITLAIQNLTELAEGAEGEGKLEFALGCLYLAKATFDSERRQ